MRWGAKPAKARVEAKPPVARKSLENEGPSPTFARLGQGNTDFAS
jgi:hypothetical protein